jgi:DNA-binding response OmpR family regulator
MSRAFRILVVDDEPFLVKILMHLLANRGFEVRSAGDGEVAVRIAMEFLPDLVLLDVMMPAMTGHEVCRLLRADPATAAAHIILLSAMGQREDRDAGLAAGADEYVIKPFCTGDLMARVEEALSSRFEEEHKAA